MGQRTCARCKRTPDEVPFRKDKRIKSDGLGAYCKPCEREYNREYYLANKTRQNAETQAYYYANRERILVQQKTYRQANIDRIRAFDRHRSRGNPANMERARLWRERNPDRARAQFRAWITANPERWQATLARRRMRMHGHDGRIERINRFAIWQRDHGICGLCGDPVPFRRMHLDHIKPLARGGEHTAGNVQPAHPRCNLRKKDREVPRWAFRSRPLFVASQSQQLELFSFANN
jgi:5-methylcytosine-specific restriction endonuclease McrA